MNCLLTFFQNGTVLVICIFGIVTFPAISVIISNRHPYFNDVTKKDLTSDET